MQPETTAMHFYGLTQHSVQLLCQNPKSADIRREYKHLPTFSQVFFVFTSQCH